MTANGGLCRFKSPKVQEYRGTSWNINLPGKKLVVGKMMINHDKPIDFEVCPVCLDQANHIRNAALRGFPHLQEAAIIRGCCLYLQKSGSTRDKVRFDLCNGWLEVVHVAVSRHMPLGGARIHHSGDL